MAVLLRDGRRIGHDRSGAGAPLLLIHAGLARRASWDGVISALGPGFSATRLDLPGHGETDGAAGADIQAVAMADALAVMSKDPAHVVGHSFGGTVALRLARDAPERVARLTLIEPVQFVLLHDAGHPAFEDHLRSVAPFEAALAAGDRERAAGLFLGVWGEGEVAAIPPARWRRMLERIHLIGETDAAILNPDLPGRVTLDDVAALTQPVQLIEGAASPPEIAAIHDVIMGALPGVRRHVIEGAGHMVPITHPGPVAALIRAFAG